MTAKPSIWWVRAAFLCVVLLAVPRPALLGHVHFRAVRLHGFDTTLFNRQTPTITLHIVSAVSALAIGTVLMLGVKGSRLHKTLGWTWVAAMTLVVGSSFMIRVINPGRFSFIHLLSAWVAISLPMAIAFVRRGDIHLHRRLMTGSFVGGLIIAGAFTFVPGRLMWRLFFG